MSDARVPLVSVITPTYQHAAYIEQCLRSITAQRTDFAVEHLIGEDESTDGTREICQRLAAEHPDRIRLFLRSRKDVLMIDGKPSGRANLIALLGAARGKYIAFCEGDDHWVDPLKLQQQVDLLEANPDVVLSFHAAQVQGPDGNIIPDKITTVPKQYEDRMDLARKGNYIHTPTVVFRNVQGELPPEFALSPIGDYFLYMLLVGHGRTRYSPEPMAVYRQGVGVWSARSEYQRHFGTAKCHGALAKYFDRTGDAAMADVFHGRIAAFIQRFRAVVTTEDIRIISELSPRVHRAVSDAFKAPQGPAPRSLVGRVMGRMRRLLGGA